MERSQPIIYERIQKGGHHTFTFSIRSLLKDNRSCSTIGDEKGG